MKQIMIRLYGKQKVGLKQCPGKSFPSTVWVRFVSKGYNSPLRTEISQ